MTPKKTKTEEIRTELQEYAWERIYEALHTKKVELPAKLGSAAQTIVFSPSDYLKLALAVANHKDGGSSRQNPPLNPDVFILPKTQ